MVRIEIDENELPHVIDPVVRYLHPSPLYLYPPRDHLKDGVTIEDSSSLIIEVLSDKGWDFLRQRIIEALTPESRIIPGKLGPKPILSGALVFHERMNVFRTFDMIELAGFDVNLTTILDEIEGKDYESVRGQLYEKVVDGLEIQISTGGPTLFLDTNRMKKTIANRLIPLIETRRIQELKDMILYVRKWGYYATDLNQFKWHYVTDLMQLWKTFYGLQALEKIGPHLERTYAEEGEIEQVLNIIESICGIRIKTTLKLSESQSVVTVSDTLNVYLKSRASVGYWICECLRSPNVKVDFGRILGSLDYFRRLGNTVDHHIETVKESMQQLIEISAIYRDENWNYVLDEELKESLPTYGQPWGGHGRDRSPQLKSPSVFEFLNQADRIEKGTCAFCGRNEAGVDMYMLEGRVFCEDHYLALKLDLLRGMTIEQGLKQLERWRESGKTLKQMKTK